MINLNISDINLSVSCVKCSGSKKIRIIPIGHKANKALRNYIYDVRGKMIKDKNEKALFVNCSGVRLSRQGFWKIVKTYQHTAGIKADITPHTLRHSFAAHLIENGAQLKDIKEMLGHSDISSTQVYAQLMKNKYTVAYAKFHPFAK